MDTNSATYKEIQIECKRLGLQAAGTREELITPGVKYEPPAEFPYSAKS